MHTASTLAAPGGAPSLDTFDEMNLDSLAEQLRRLAEVNDELLRVGSQPPVAPAPALAPVKTPEPVPTYSADDYELLQLENDELRQRIAALEKQLVASSSDDHWVAQLSEYEQLLEEKSETIRTLNQRLQEMQERGVTPAGPRNSGSDTPQAEEMLAMRRELQEERARLAEDREEMMIQMREMEMALSRDRAELARQRQDMTRAQSDLAREQEQSLRGVDLHEKMKNLRGSGNGTGEPQRPSQEKSGLIRRLFG